MVHRRLRAASPRLPPPVNRPFRTKADLAAELVEGWHRRGELPASWPVGDEWFGRHQARLDRIAAVGLR